VPALTQCPEPEVRNVAFEFCRGILWAEALDGSEDVIGEFAHGGLDLIEELAELGSTMASIAPTDDPSGHDVEAANSDVVPVSSVVMAPSGRLAGIG
jgi:hypothetical protein